MSSFMVSAPGKVIVFGEHAVVHGRAAIAAAISLRSYLLITRDEEVQSISLTFPDIDFTHAWPIESIPWQAFKQEWKPDDINHPVTKLDSSFVSALQPLLDPISLDKPEKVRHIHHAAAKAFLYILLSISNGTPSAAHTFTMRSTIPIGAGLGSSASISVCIATAALQLTNLLPPASSPEANSSTDKQTLALINHWAYVGELAIHGTPSGVDNTVATLGRAVHFKRPNPTSAPTITPIDFPVLPLLIVNTKQSRNTSAEVAKVRAYLEKHPAIVNCVLDAIDSLTEAAHLLIADAQGRDDEKVVLEAELGALFRTNHCLLASLGVSHPRLERIRTLIDEAGVGFTKLTGGGGGGCAISLVREFEKDLEKQLTEEGFEVHETVLGAKGVALWDGEGGEAEVLDPQRFLTVDLETRADGWGWKYWS